MKGIRLIFIFLLITSCNLQTKKEKMGIFDRFKKQKTEQEEYIIPYDLADSNSEKLITIKIGNLNLPSGQIIASDPFFTHDIKPFRRKVKPGKYPVELSILKIEDDHYRIAFSKIKFKEEKSTKWILAIREDINQEDIKSLKGEEYFGFPVEAGLGCFLDKKTNDLLVKKLMPFTLKLLN